MATTTTFISVEEYLRSSFDPDAEYIDGQIQERTVGENDHSAWQAAICAWFQQDAKAMGIRVRPGLRVQVAPTCFLIPDVTLLDRNRPIEKIATHPPVAVFEVLSPTDTLKRSWPSACCMSRWGSRPFLSSIRMAQNTDTSLGGSNTSNTAPSIFPEARPASI